MREPTESSRMMRGAGESISEYISELRTEIMDRRVGCDGMPKRYLGKSIGYYDPVLTEA